MLPWILWSFKRMKTSRFDWLLLVGQHSQLYLCFFVKNLNRENLIIENFCFEILPAQQSKPVLWLSLDRTPNAIETNIYSLGTIRANKFYMLQSPACMKRIKNPTLSLCYWIQRHLPLEWCLDVQPFVSNLLDYLNNNQPVLYQPWIYLLTNPCARKFW